ncbi:zinc ribbon domain-containing protein [Flavilitoribacter nigricans]|uniref:zinc ribbon domain-containing protein n=1 Tax=Flavilitoribacter nigricans TaxID=70997 RepID=UPI000C05045A|nr:zinc ribbon domain-containing protein [Flavilitoribacter nigricans]
MKSCPNCQTPLPDEARFCIQCGAPQHEQKAEDAIFTVNWDDEVATQISAHFFAALQQKVRTELGKSEHLPFSERVYESGFRDIVERRAKQVGEKLQAQLNTDAISVRTANKKVGKLLEELTDFFIIRYCQDLLDTPLPESILKYQHLDPQEIDLFQMVLDYLDFAHESEVVYTDFLTMPVNKLKNAGRSFLFPEKSEKILLICDQSLFGSCKEGFALTEKAIYWKAHLQKARQVAYDQLKGLEREKEWININGYFFNVNPSLNQKMLKLLKRLSAWSA